MKRINKAFFQKGKFILLLLIVMATLEGLAQNARKAALQKQYSTILAEIKQLQNSIDETKKFRNMSLKEVAMINEKIAKRKKLIENIEFQKKVIDAELGEKEKEVLDINDEKQKVIEEYKKLILWLNKNNNSVNKLAFVLEANNFKEAYHRIIYIKKYGDYRARQKEYLTNQINRIIDRISSLNQVKAEKINILLANQHQQKELQVEKQNRDSMVTKLGKELDALKSQVRMKNQQAYAVNARIKRIIEEEMKKQLEAEDKARKLREKKNTESVNKTPSNPEYNIEKSPDGILSNSFQSSKGALPWPVSSGVVTSKFGRQPHPADPDLMIDNNGIDIKTSDNADVRAIYKGRVVRIFDMPTYQTCVLVKHGDFFSVYSYMKSTFINEGSEVQAGQSLGKCGYDEAHGYSLVNLQIWHYQNKQNPQTWLSGR